jgi:hypothetical protein
MRKLNEWLFDNALRLAAACDFYFVYRELPSSLLPNPPPLDVDHSKDKTIGLRSDALSRSLPLPTIAIDAYTGFGQQQCNHGNAARAQRAIEL